MTKERARMVGNLTKKIRNVKCPGGGVGGMGTLGFDSYIKRLMFKIVNGYTTTPPMKWPDRLETQATLFYSFLRSTKENVTLKWLGCLWSDVRLLSSPGKRD